MENLGGWHVLLWLAAVYVAVAALVRMMRARRDEVVIRLRRQVEQEQERQRQKLRQQRMKEIQDEQMERMRSRRAEIQKSNV